MKKILLVISVILSSIEGIAQSPNKVHDLYYPNEKQTTFYPTGIGIRNDTLWIDDSAPVNIVAIRREGTTYFTCILLKTYREEVSQPREFEFITKHSEIPNVKKNPLKKGKKITTKGKSKAKKQN